MLFLKECKKIMCSMPFVLYVVIIVAMYFSQFEPVLKKPLTQPQEGMEYYGSIEKEVPEVLMPKAVESLVSEYLLGSYGAYPWGFYKEVKLTEAKAAKMAEIIEELSCVSREELDNFAGYEPGGYQSTFDENGNQVVAYKEAVLPYINIPESMSYEAFKELMVRADELIGGGSKYREKYLVSNFSVIPMTYEEALKEYEEIMQEENIAEVYIRLYCDYMGIILAIMPVFVCVSLWQMDKRAHMEQLIYSRKSSSVKVVGLRYLALIFCMVILTALTFVHAIVGINNLYPDKNIFWGKAIVLCLLWLLPEIMIVSAIGALLSELLSSLPAIFVQGVWWYITLEMNKLTGSITKWTLIIRHNTLGEPELFERQFSDFVWNRCGYILLSVICICITMFVYEKKRRGAFHDRKISQKKEHIWKNHSNESQA